jgi:hypothetical protein
MHNQKKYTISFLPHQKDLIQFVQEKRKTQNLSAYFRELVRCDMENQEANDLESIYLYVAKRLSEDGYRQQDVGDKEKLVLTEDEKNAIKGLF